MLGSQSLQNHVKNSHVLDAKPVVFLEFNGNDYGDPYIYGTGNLPPSNFSSSLLGLSPRDGSPATSNVDRGFATASHNNSFCTLIKVTGSKVRGTASENSYRYTADVPAVNKNVKFHMFLKSDYTFQYQTDPDVDETFNVVITAVGLDQSNKIVKSEIVTENIEVNSIDWKSVTIMYANPDDDVEKVRLNIYLSPAAGRKSSLLVNKLSYFPISDYEVYVKNRLSVGEVFETFRPGEFMVDMPSSKRPNIKIDDQFYPQQCTPVQMCMSYAVGPKYRNVQRSVTPMPGNPYTYYVSGTKSNTKSVWAIYRNKIKTNKIVLKVNALGLNIKNFNIKILTSEGWSTNISPAGITPDEHGILVLYLKENLWSNIPWDNENHPYIQDSGTNPSLDGDILYKGSQISVGYKEIHGISIDVNSMESVNTDFNDYNISQARLELIELSPRLEVDVSNFIESLNIDQELSNNDFALPIGGITSNSLKISLSNIPIINASSNLKKIPISNISSTSKFDNLLRKGLKARALFKINTSSDINNPVVEYVPAFTGYLDNWNESDTQVSMNFFDAVKNLQSTRTRPLYLKGNKANDIIAALFDTVGFGEFDAEQLRKIRGLGRRNVESQYTSNNDVVSHFWTTKERSITETLFDITKVFQIGIYCDAYGAINFKSLHTFNTKYLNLINNESQVGNVFYIQDYTDNKSLSNLVSADLIESYKPESIIIRYITPRPSIGQDADEDAASNKIIKRPFGRDIVWSIDGADHILPYLYIADEGIQSASQSYIPYYVKANRSLPNALPFSSMLLVDEEIMSYDGIEYKFQYKVGSQENSFVRSIKSSEDIENVVSEIFTEFNGKSIRYSETGRLLNVKRGLFGTRVSRHVKTGTDSISNWKMIKFTKSGQSYINGTNVPRKTGKWSETQNGIKITSNSDKEMLFLYPEDADDDSPFLKNKKRMSTQIKLGDIPKNKEGYLGVGVGLEYDSNNKLTNGLLIWVGVESGKKKQKPNAYVQQVKSDGTLETIISKNNFDYAEDLIEEDENIEIFVALNDDRKRCSIFLGGTTLFQKTVKKKIPGKKKKKEIKKVQFDIRQLNKKSRFGVIASGAGVGVLGQMQFGVSKKPEDLNDLDISDIDDDYQGRVKKPNRLFFIGNNTLLDNIVYGQNIAGINDSSGDNFVYTGAPVGRGIKLFEVEYDSYPVISQPVHVWEGYTYSISIFEEADLISEKEPPDIG